MARPESTIDLTDAEKRDLVTLIQAGKPLPAKYRFMRFDVGADFSIDMFGNDTMTIVPVNAG